MSLGGRPTDGKLFAFQLYLTSGRKKQNFDTLGVELGSFLLKKDR